VLPLLPDLAAEHRMYLPLAPVLTAVVLSVHLAWGKLIRGWKERPALPASLAVTAAATVLGVLAMRRNMDYADEYRIWSDTILKCEAGERANPRAYNNRGLAALQQGQVRQAAADLSRAIRLRPKEARYYYNRAAARRAAGEDEAALADFAVALRLHPGYAEAHLNRGNLYSRMQRWEEAASDFRQVMRLRPDHPAGYFNLGNLHLELGENESAAARYTEALERHPNHARALSNRALAFLRLGRAAEARADAEASRRLGCEPAEELKKLLEGPATP
jgi:tetratricopeptide (TPR) repeat protein